MEKVCQQDTGLTVHPYRMMNGWLILIFESHVLGQMSWPQLVMMEKACQQDTGHTVHLYFLGTLTKADQRMVSIYFQGHGLSTYSNKNTDLELIFGV